MKIAALYPRVSTDDQADNGSSIESQTEALLKRANERGYIVPDGYIFPEDFSGYYMERPQLQRIQQLAREGKIDVLLVYDIDRLSRNHTHQIVLKYQFTEQYGIALEFVRKDFNDTTLDGRLNYTLRGAAAEITRESILEQTARGRHSRAKRGAIMGASVPKYGYVFDTGKKEHYVIDEEAAKVVRYIFRLCAEGKTAKQIAERLNQENIPTRSVYLHAKGFVTSRRLAPIWSRADVTYLLKDPVYKGEYYAYRYKGHVKREKDPLNGVVRIVHSHVLNKQPETRIPLECPAIVSVEVWEAAQAILLHHKRARLSKSSLEGIGILRGGFGTCAYCKSSLHVQTYVCTGRSWAAVYRCGSINSGIRDCPNSGMSIRTHIFDKMIWDDLVRFITHSDWFIRLYEEKLGSDEAPKPQEYYDLSSNQGALAAEKEKKAALLAHIGFSTHPATMRDLTESMDRCSVNIERLEKEVARLSSLVSNYEKARTQIRGVLDHLETAISTLAMASFEEKRALLQILGVRVRLFSSQDLQARGKRYSISLNFGGIEQNVECTNDVNSTEVAATPPLQ